jgi:RNA polymerase sigma-32 factor
MLATMSVYEGDWAPPGFLSAIRTAPMLSRDEESRLARSVQLGDAAAGVRLVLSHLRFVVRVARGYRHSGVPMADLVQEGTVGLIQAVRRFNPDQGTRLATYAMWWIRASIQERVVRSWSLVRVGTTAAQKALFLSLRRRGTGELTDTLARAFAQRFGVKPSEVVDLARRAFARDRSLDEPSGERGRSDRLSLLPDSGSTPEERVAEAGQLRFWRALLWRALSALPPREQVIIRRRYLSEARATFEALSHELGLSKERVRQLESAALGKLKSRLAAARRGEVLPGA